MRIETYGTGGFDPSKPNSNMLSVLDADGYRRWDSGQLVEQRPLTMEEELLVGATPQVNAEDRLAAAASALAALDDISAPVLPADVLDILTDVRTALEA